LNCFYTVANSFRCRRPSGFPPPHRHTHKPKKLHAIITDKFAQSWYFTGDFQWHTDSVRTYLQLQQASARPFSENSEQINNQLDRMLKEAVAAYLKYCPDIALQRLG